MTAPLPLTVSEAAFQSAVIDLARLTGWRVCHFRPALRNPRHEGQTRRWSTPIEGDAGLPDLILARDGVVILAELKSQRGTLTPGQREWLAALGPHGRCWRPADWPEVLATLRGAA